MVTCFVFYFYASKRLINTAYYGTVVGIVLSMNASTFAPFLILLSLFVAVSSVAAWYIFTMRKSIKKFMGDTSLDEDTAHGLMRRIARLEAKTEETDPRLAVLEQVATSSIQKVGFVRFNPFQDTGGDNSFMLALLDRNNNGVLLSSLYMREGARLYAKSIENGQAKHVLSAEEHKLLQETLHTI